MKKDRFYTVLLVISMALSLVCTYFISINTSTLPQFINSTINKESSTETTESENAKRTYFQLSQPKYQDVFSPDKIVIKQNNVNYLVDYPDLVSNVIQRLADRPFEIQDTQVYKMDTHLRDALLQDGIQLLFPEPVQLSTLGHFLIENDDVNEGMLIDTIFLISKDNSIAYLIDHTNNTYLKVNSHDSLSEDIWKMITSVKKSWRMVEEYEGKRQAIYLPVEAPKVSTQVYTLDSLPDSLFISKIFPDSEFIIPKSENEGELIYRTYRYMLTINSLEQLLNLTIQSAQDEEAPIVNDKLISSFEPLKSYEYWNNGIKYFDKGEDYLIYRRYLNGYPIFSEPSLPEYGATKIYLRNHESSDVYRYQMPLLILNVHIDDLSKSIKLESANDILEQLAQHHIALSDVSDIRIAYEWQKDMEDFKKVTFIPKWYIEVEGKYYRLEDLDNVSGSESMEEEAVSSGL